MPLASRLVSWSAPFRPQRKNKSCPNFAVPTTPDCPTFPGTLTYFGAAILFCPWAANLRHGTTYLFLEKMLVKEQGERTGCKFKQVKPWKLTNKTIPILGNNDMHHRSINQRIRVQSMGWARSQMISIKETESVNRILKSITNKQDSSRIRWTMVRPKRK